MITSTQMLKNAQTQIEGMNESLRLVREQHEQGKLSAKDAEINIGSINHIISKRQAEIDEYLSLTSGSMEYINPRKLEDLPKTMIQLRLALGWSQKKLADELGVQQQQIARYEATDYEGISFQRMLVMLDAYDAHISIEKIRMTIDGKSHDKFKKPKELSTELYEVRRKQIAEDEAILKVKNLKMAK